MNSRVIHTPHLGVAIIATFEQKLLLGKRSKAPMTGSWQLPGGWVGYLETPQKSAIRRLHEFSGLQHSPLKFITYTDNRFDTGLHSISLYFHTHCQNADQVNLHTNKHCSDWLWADWYDLPQPLFLPLERLLQSGYDPFSRKK